MVDTDRSQRRAQQSDGDRPRLTDSHAAELRGDLATVRALVDEMDRHLHTSAERHSLCDQAIDALRRLSRDGRAAPSVGPKRRGRVLVVDVEPMVATAVRMMLSLHHDVLAETSVRSAIERVARGEKFDVILCDLVLAAMGEPSVPVQLSKIATEQAKRVVFMGRQNDVSRFRSLVDEVPNPCIEKPFGQDAIRAIVDEMVR